MALVSFSQGLYADYLLIPVKDPHQLYFCTDTNQIFVGSIEYTAGVKQLQTLPTTGVSLGTIVQYVGQTTDSYKNGYFYRYGQNGWESISTEPAQPPLYITWANYQQLSQDEIRNNRYIIVDYPGTPISVDAVDVSYKNTTVYAALNELYSATESTTDSIGPQEASSTASTAHTAGSYFINSNGDLCRTTRDIAIGDTITPGINCVVTTLCAELESARSFTII